MSRGVGSVRKQGTTWSYCLWDADAQKRTPWKKLPDVTSRREAEAVMHQKKVEWDQQRLLSTLSLPASAIEFSTAAGKIALEDGLHVNDTWSKYYERWTVKWIRINGDAPIDTYTQEDAHKYIAARRSEKIKPKRPKSGEAPRPPKRTSESTIRKEVAFLARVFRRHGNPIFEHVRRPSEPKGAVRFLTPQQFDSLLAASPPDRAFRYQFLVLTGARCGEAWKLTWRDINLETWTVQITNAAKGAGPRYPFRRVPIPMQLRAVLQERCGAPDDLLFPVQSNWLRDLKEVDCVVAKIPAFRVHDLRHTYGSWLAQHGVSLLAIRDLMGHASVTTTERYAHLLPDTNHAAVAALGNVHLEFCSTSVLSDPEKDLGWGI